MKKTILALTLLTLGSAGAYAQVAGGVSTDKFSIRIDTRDGNNRMCERQLRKVQTENYDLKTDLRNCQIRPRVGNGSELREVKRELLNTKYELKTAKNKIYDLKLEVARLESQVRNPRRGDRRSGHFDLAASITACKGISSSYSAQQCAGLANKHKVDAAVIKACTKISSSSSAVNCVSYAGQFKATKYQVNACVQISSSYSASECVKTAGKGQVPGDVVQACVYSSSSSSSQLSCVANVANNY